MQFKQIKETCLYISDVDLSEQFYHDLLGLPIINKVRGKHIFFRAGNSVLLCFISEDSKRKDSPPPHFGEGKMHFAFETSTQEYDRWKQKIISLGLEIIDEVTWKNGQQSFYFNDPDGHVLEIVPEGIWD